MEEKDINFIKWMCDKAEGFVYFPEMMNWEIKTDGNEIHLLKDTCSECYFQLVTNPDIAKESALQHIYDQERKE